MNRAGRKQRRLPRERRRETLLSAARTIVMERGYGELTMGRVAAATGVSKTLVYDHFAHRRELYLAVLADERVRLVQRLAPALAYGDREERVRSGVHAFLELVDEYGDGYAELFRNPIAHDPELAGELRRVRDGVAEMVAGLIARDVGVPVETVLLPAQAIVGSMEAAADWLTRTPQAQRPTLERTTAVLSRLIWQGLDGLGRAEARAAAENEPVPLRPRADRGA
jgi:AcrR family transcriptional regulator